MSNEGIELIHTFKTIKKDFTMDNLYAEWSALSAKIKQLPTVRDVIDLNQHNRPSLQHIGQHINSALSALSDFNNNFSSRFSQKVLERLQSLPQPINLDSHSGPLDGPIMQTLTQLNVLEAELSYLLKNTQERIHRTVEIAFAHLQRQIVADTSRDKARREAAEERKEDSKNLQEQRVTCDSVHGDWVEAFDDKRGEEACEALGANHLLLHKIWASKLNAEGERTDLVLQELIDTNDPLYKSADGLILTEWKKVPLKKRKKTKKTIEEDKEAIKQAVEDVAKKVIEKAAKQARRYKEGLLFPMELSDYCYLIILSKKKLPISESEYRLPDCSLKFRVVNIVCDPDIPSVEAQT